jgi:hypothetical protein
VEGQRRVVAQVGRSAGPFCLVGERRLAVLRSGRICADVASEGLCSANPDEQCTGRLDRIGYRGRRKIGRLINRLEQFRRAATPSEK